MRESTFKSRLNSILKDNATERFIGNKKKGKINTKRLYKILDSGKIFKKKEERKGKDYSITLLLDASGSMQMSADDVAKSVAHIGNALNGTDIPFSVYSFSKCVRLIKTFDEKYDERNVTRLYHKSFSTTFTNCYNCFQYDIQTVKNEFGKQICPHCGSDQIERDGNGGTNDALALHTVGNEVHKKYKKNILIVLTDGSGDNISSSRYLIGKSKFSDMKNNRTVLFKLHKKYEDLIVLGISLGADYTQEVYGKRFSRAIRTPSEVFTAVAKLLASHIKRG